MSSSARVAASLMSSVLRCRLDVVYCSATMKAQWAPEMTIEGRPTQTKKRIRVQQGPSGRCKSHCESRHLGAKVVGWRHSRHPPLALIPHQIPHRHQRGHLGTRKGSTLVLRRRRRGSVVPHKFSASVIHIGPPVDCSVTVGAERFRHTVLLVLAMTQSLNSRHTFPRRSCITACFTVEKGLRNPRHVFPFLHEAWR